VKEVIPPRDEAGDCRTYAPKSIELAQLTTMSEIDMTEMIRLEQACLKVPLALDIIYRPFCFYYCKDPQRCSHHELSPSTMKSRFKDINLELPYPNNRRKGQRIIVPVVKMPIKSLWSQQVQ
jgi:hypothetical protein